MDGWHCSKNTWLRERIWEITATRRKKKANTFYLKRFLPSGIKDFVQGHNLCRREKKKFSSFIYFLCEHFSYLLYQSIQIISRKNNKKSTTPCDWHWVTKTKKKKKVPVCSPETSCPAENYRFIAKICKIENNHKLCEDIGSDKQ